MAVRQTVLAAFGDVLDHPDRLSRMALPWLLLIAATTLLSVAHPAQRSLAWAVSLLVTLLGSIAISVAWFRWRVAGIEPVAMARLDRPVARVLLRYLAHPLLVATAFGAILLPLLGLDRIRDFSKAEATLAGSAVFAVTVITFLATFPLFHIFALLGAVDRPGTRLADIVRASRGSRLRLTAAYALFFLLVVLIPLFGLSSADELIRHVARGLKVERTPEMSDMVDGVLAILAQSVALGLSAASASFVARLWPQLAAPPPAAAPPQPPG
ncbi:MAG: hypothetical protein U1E14_16600 [Geminicoccaceae bacterium]